MVESVGVNDLQEIHKYLDQFESTDLGGIADGMKGYTFITSIADGTPFTECPGELIYFRCQEESEMESKHIEQVRGITDVMISTGMKPMVRVRTERNSGGNWLYTRMTYETVNS